MLNVHSSGKLLTWVWSLLIIFSCNTLFAITMPGTESVFPDTTLNSQTDTLQFQEIINNDTLVVTSLAGDTVLKTKENSNKIDAEVKRTARDSIVEDIKHRKIFLYGDAVVTYKQITLKAAYIEVDMSTNTVFATGVADSTGKMIGNPEFTESGQTFKSKTMTYNFDTQKGIISSVITEDGQGFLHGQKIKKLKDNTVNIAHGSYTTCNLEEHPHYGFKFNRARVIPDSKIVTGPAYLEIEGMPTPIALPFGFFPNKSGQTSGILIPTYGESNTRGFFLENGGYYWAINEYMDFQVLGDIYSGGGWGIKPRFRYKKRYRYGGDFNMGYAVNIIGTKVDPDYSNKKAFSIRWSHQQDPKARPNSTFTASVNIVSSGYAKYNTESINEFLSNEFQSSVAYQRNWNNKVFLTLNGSHRQNTKTHVVDITLPEINFKVNTFYPLRRKGGGGKKRFYEDLSINYTTTASNKASSTDSTVFTPAMWENEVQWGAKHNIPISLPIKVLKHFTLSTTATFTDRMAGKTIRKHDILNDSTKQQIDTIPGFRNSMDYTFSSSLSTKLFGMALFKKGPIRAIRHVLTPTVGFSYTPDFSTSNYGYYDTYLDLNGNEVKYSEFESTLYGSPPGQKSGSITFGLSNNLEMKVPSKKDTITGLRKVVLIESFNISGSYNVAADSLNMSMISMSGRTTLFKGLSVQYASSWDPYAADSAGRRYNKFQWDVNRKLLRIENSSWRLNLSYTLSDKDFGKNKGKQETTAPTETPSNATENEMEEIENNPEDFVDWKIPWSLSVNFNFTYTSDPSYINYMRIPKDKIVSTLGLNGQINITPKWKFTFTTGWDFTQSKMSLTNISLYRDLHCWEMRFNWVPTGARQSWNFSLNVKASILQDLKLNKKKDYRDNF
ncbi:MAG: putative LPS assembly protein LptD [Bacteroidales bacterium]|nr:putative LPS assembly protein LptD [Bacteroidales bacterium]